MVVKKNTIYRLLCVLVFAVMAIICIIYLYNKPENPEAEVHEARLKISQAANITGPYAESLLYAARNYYDSAIEEWVSQNQKIILFRDYSKIKDFSRKATFMAELSIGTSEDFRKNMLVELNANQLIADSIAIRFKTHFSSLPLNEEYRNTEFQALLKLEEGRIAFEKGDLMHSKKCIKQALDSLAVLQESIEYELKEYFQQHNTWTKWVQETIDLSKKEKSAAIVIDKFGQRCHVYQSGRLIASFPADLGVNWIGDKIKSGDKTTPEGKYKVIKKKKGTETIYYKALLINYPNNDDRERFRQFRLQGLLHNRDEIGANIEIHGGGGKNIHWTDGCIALNNEDMEQLYHLVREGTPIVIIGSLRPFDQVFTNNIHAHAY
ncbi:MAG: L,D-transpeptidase [Cyclobacteriaceae bacterium]|nr:L,D-transpeptidase [Cyclobacteriaceae bacterium]